MNKFVLNYLCGQYEHHKFLVFNFHDVFEHCKPDDAHAKKRAYALFEKQLVWLSKYFDIVDLSSGVTQLQRGMLNKPTAALTFDDGYASHYTHAAPLLNKLDIPATFFVSSGHLDNSVLWNDWIEYFCLYADELEIRQFIEELPSIVSYEFQTRSQAKTLINDCLKYQTLEVRGLFIEQLKSRFNESHHPTKLMLQTEHVKKLKDDGFEVGGHTVNHPILRKEAFEDAYVEIKNDLIALQHITGCPIKSFAFPNGKPETDMDYTHLEMLSKLGIQVAVSSCAGYFLPAMDPLQVPRLCLSGESSLRWSRQVMSAFSTQPIIINSRGYEKAN